MKCLICDSYSLSHICKSCQQTHLQPSLFKNRVGDVEVISFYDYDTIQSLLHTKYEKIGSSILSILVKNSMKPFLKEFSYPHDFKLTPIDDRVNQRDYSHTAVLAKSAKSKQGVLHGALQAQSNYHYATQKLDFKLKHPRGFQYSSNYRGDVILVDDVVTDGVTINEAKRVLSEQGVNVLFALVLSYSKR
jgi:competence protein ComFC